MPNQNLYLMPRIHRATHPMTVDLELSIESLMMEYYSYIHRLAFSILDDFSEADDATQETFIHAHRALSSFRAEANLKTWLTTIALNACRARLRKRKARDILLNTLHALHLLRSLPLSTEDHVVINEGDRAIWQAVDDLDEKHKITIILRYVQGMNVADIASVLHLNQGTVHSRLHYARQKLHTQLKHLHSGEEVSDESSG